MSMTFFDGMSTARVRRALNVLTEAPFFYPSDDPELFAWTRRHRVELARFFADAFEWQLVVEQDVARLHKGRWYNDALTPRQRASFEPTRTGECVALLLLLEVAGDPSRAGVDDAASERGAAFSMGELLSHAVRRMAELGQSERFDETRLRDLFRELMPSLLRHRLVRERALPRGASEPEPVKRYEPLPGLRLYDRRALDERALAEALGVASEGASSAAEREGRVS
ncbi:MAG: DUF2398 family protein [Sandaracinus sp.]